jgi:hypothetical protein
MMYNIVDDDIYHTRRQEQPMTEAMIENSQVEQVSALYDEYSKIPTDEGGPGSAVYETFLDWFCKYAPGALTRVTLWKWHTGKVESFRSRYTLDYIRRLSPVDSKQFELAGKWLAAMFPKYED